MTTRRRALLRVAASLGAVGSAGGLATPVNAAPDSSPAQIEAAVSGEALNEIRATNQQLHAELEDEKALTAGLERINHHLRLEFDLLRGGLAPYELLAENERLRGTLRDIVDQQDEWWSRSRLKAAEALATTRGTRGQYYCSFCRKSREQVRRLIAGPGAVYICDECVDLCHEIIHEEPAPLAAC